MNKLLRKRDWLILALMALSFTACTKACGKKEMADLGGGKVDALNYIPQESNLLVKLDWQKFIASPLGQPATEKVPSFAKALIEKIEAVTVGLEVSADRSKKPTGIAVISASLNEAELQTLMFEGAKKEGKELKTEEYKGKKIFRAGSNDEGGLSMVSNGVILMGQDLELKKAIDLGEEKGKSVKNNKALMDLVVAAQKSRMLWAVASVPAGLIPQSPQGGAQNPMAALEKMSAVDLGIDYDAAKLNVDLGAKLENEDAAKGLVTTLNSYVTLFGAGLAQKDPNIASLMKSLSIGNKKERLLISLAVEKQVLESLTQKAMMGVKDPAEEAPQSSTE